MGGIAAKTGRPAATAARVAHTPVALQDLYAVLVLGKVLVQHIVRRFDQLRYVLDANRARVRPGHLRQQQTGKAAAASKVRQ